nr:30S ribosomal protein S1 [Vallitaleaceae bacterium]
VVVAEEEVVVVAEEEVDAEAEAEAEAEAKAIVEEVVEVEVVKEVDAEAEVTKEAEAKVVEEAEAEAVEAIPSMADYEAEVAASMRKIRTGDIVSGYVITVTRDELLVNIDYIADGIVPAAEILRINDEALADMYKVGDKVKAEILKKDDGEGNVLLSLKKGAQMIVWDELEAHYKNESVINITVSEVVKGGLVCMIKGIRAFMPASLASAAYVEDLSTFVGQSLDVKVVDFDMQKQKVILSRKVIEMVGLEEKRAAFYDTIKVGDRITGTVKKLMNFGAFVNIGPVDGLVRNQDLSWSRVKHPSEVVKEGDTVEVYVTEVDKAKKRIGLGLKDIKDDPFAANSAEFTAGKVYEGEVTRVVDFGAFVKLGEGFEGLVHISQLSDERVEKPSDIVKEGDKVQVKIVEINTKDKRIRLSMKDAKEAEESAQVAKYAQEEGNATTNLKDVFSAFLKDIEK